MNEQPRKDPLRTKQELCSLLVLPPSITLRELPQSVKSRLKYQNSPPARFIDGIGRLVVGKDYEGTTPKILGAYSDLARIKIMEKIASGKTTGFLVDERV